MIPQVLGGVMLSCGEKEVSWMMVLNPHSLAQIWEARRSGGVGDSAASK